MGVASGSWSTRASDSGFVAMVNNDLSLICGYTLGFEYAHCGVFCHARYTSDEYYTYPNSYVFTKRIQTDTDEVELECL